MSAARPPVASVRHTAILVAILLGVAAYGVYSQRVAAQGPVDGARGSTVPLYLSLMTMEWALLAYALVGAKKTGTSLRDLLGERWTGWRSVARDVGIALAAWVVWTAGATAVDTMLPGGEEDLRAITALLPRSPAEIALWVALSITAGICEEAVYRGYLQRQFEAFTRSAPIAVAAQALIFGVSHGYQGVRNVIAITIYGALFGLLAWWRKSLKPGVLLHAWTDVFGGIFQRRF